MYHFDYNKLAKSCENTVNPFTKYTFGMQILYHSRGQSGMGQIKLLRSGLTAHLRANEAQLSSLGKQQLRAWMASRANADMDAKTRDRDPIKLSNAKESLSFTDYEKLVGQLFQDGKLFLWQMLVLQWNLIARVNNVGTLMWTSLGWQDDHLTITFPRTKKDQLGSRSLTIRLFANPGNYKFCPRNHLTTRYSAQLCSRCLINNMKE